MNTPDSEEPIGLTIAEQLRKLGFKVAMQVNRNGERLDVFAESPKGISVAVELRNWRNPTEDMLHRARKQAGLMTQALNVDYAWIVVPAITDQMQTASVRNLQGITSSAEEILRQAAAPGIRGALEHRFQSEPRTEGKPKRFFVAMPFSSGFEDTYYLCIVPAADRAGGFCVRIDEQFISGNIVEAIWKEITQADLIIADLTGANPNVAYEVGYAHALGKKTILISATAPEQLPFDFRQWQTIGYANGQLHQLKRKLENLLKTALTR